MSGSPVKKGQKRQYPGHNFSEDDPLGLNLNADEILYGDNDNEVKTEKEKIPKNVNDPLGLDSKPDLKSNKRRRSSVASLGNRNDGKKGKKQKHVNKKNDIFPHGNYRQYYGYRNQDKFSDYRLSLIEKSWITGLDVLDIGCNAGHLTLLLARDHHPRKIVGVDIDPVLIQYAQKNIRHYCPTEKKFPESFASLYGPLRAPYVNTGQVNSSGGKEFPENVVFIQGNYVFSCDEFLDRQEPEYDTIIAFSITKWVHLNNGDAGLKRFFRRIFRQLRPGGRLLLEPQPWKSYQRRKKLTKEIEENFPKLNFKPAEFQDFLVKIGFCEPVTITDMKGKDEKVKGFRGRDIYMFTKPLNI